MSSGRSWTKSLFVGLWTALNFSRKLFFNIIFIIFFIAIISVFMQDKNPITVPASSALVLKLKGNLVIEKQAVDPLEEFMAEAFEQEPENPEVLLQNVLHTIENAKQDKRIKALVLDLHGLDQHQSKQEIAALLYACQKEHAQCVCIVHGIGSRILKNKVPHWLVQHPDVMAFHQAPLEWGGDGALLVLIELKDKYCR